MRLLFDEDFNLRIVRGLLRRVEDLDWRSANELELRGKTDEGILLIAAAEKRIVVSHDVNTMTATFQTLEAAGTLCRVCCWCLNGCRSEMRSRSSC